MAVSFKTRKALGKRYGIDPAILLEMERLNQQYNLAPGREARALQASQFAESMSFNREQADLGRREREEANKQAAKSGMMGTVGNLATTGLTLRALTKGQGEPFFGKWGASAAEKPADVSMTTQTPGQIQQSGGYYGAGLTGTQVPALSSGLPVHGPQGSIPAGSSYRVTPASIDAAASGFSAGTGQGAAGAGETAAAPSLFAEGGTIVSDAYPLSTYSGAGTTVGTAASTLGYLAAGRAAGQIGGRWVETAGGGPESNNLQAKWGRTIQDPLGGIGKPLVREVGLENETTDTIFAILNPVGKVFEQIGWSGAGGGGGTVICTELHRQGIMSDEMLEKDKAFGARQDLETIRGYHCWAIPLAGLMRKSKLVTWVITPIAMAWAEDMAGGDNGFGRFLNKIGIPICRFIGRRALEVAHG